MPQPDHTATATATAALHITPEAVAAFQADGAVCLRGLLTPEQVATLASGINHNLAHLSPRAVVASQPGDPGHFVEDFCNWQHNPAYRLTVLHTALPAAAAALMRSTQVRLYHDHMLTKEPGTRQPTPWHQDQPYYNVAGWQNISFWVPVDPVRRASTLEFVAGSHLGPWLMPRTFLTHQARWFAPGTLAERPDIDRLRQDPASGVRVIGWALQPGDVVAFHMLTLHASAGVDADVRRRVFSARYLGDDMRHAPRAWVTSPPFEGLAERLPAGAVMNDPLFPVVWPQAPRG
jgi:ectoine hydroxylase-related dioxygenase (phytanoyl-CoA dioxygenase family)